MDNLLLSAREPSIRPKTNTIFCPSLRGLTETQAELAIIMPRLDHNREVRETNGHGQWAALLACDPFGSEKALFRALIDNEFVGVANWPSTIVFEGEMRQSMATIPASPEMEYAFLSRAAESGLQTCAFFISLEQGKQAINAGLRSLVLHPGLFDAPDENGAAMIRAALQAMVDTLKSTTADICIRVYTSSYHEGALGLSKLSVDGFVQFEGAL